MKLISKMWELTLVRVSICVVTIFVLWNADLSGDVKFHAGLAEAQRVLVIIVATLVGVFNVMRSGLRAVSNPTTRNTHRLLSIVRFLYCPTDVEMTFEPIIADWQEELFKATNTNKMWKAKWINVYYRFAFIKAMALNKISGVMEKLIGVFNSTT
jgi:hypothetical protein